MISYVVPTQQGDLVSWTNAARSKIERRIGIASWPSQIASRSESMYLSANLDEVLIVVAGSSEQSCGYVYVVPAFGWVHASWLTKLC